MLKSNSNKLMLWGGGNIILFKNRFQRDTYNFYVSLQLNNIFHVKGLIRFTLYVNLIDDRRKP